MPAGAAFYAAVWPTRLKAVRPRLAVGHRVVIDALFPESAMRLTGLGHLDRAAPILVARRAFDREGARALIAEADRLVMSGASSNEVEQKLVAEHDHLTWWTRLVVQLRPGVTIKALTQSAAAQLLGQNMLDVVLIDCKKEPCEGPAGPYLYLVRGDYKALLVQREGRRVVVDLLETNNGVFAPPPPAPGSRVTGKVDEALLERARTAVTAPPQPLALGGPAGACAQPLVESAAWWCAQRQDAIDELDVMQRLGGLTELLGPGLTAEQRTSFLERAREGLPPRELAASIAHPVDAFCVRHAEDASTLYAWTLGSPTTAAAARAYPKGKTVRSAEALVTEVIEPLRTALGEPPEAFRTLPGGYGKVQWLLGMVTAWGPDALAGPSFGLVRSMLDEAVHAFGELRVEVSGQMLHVHATAPARP